MTQSYTKVIFQKKNLCASSWLSVFVSAFCFVSLGCNDMYDKARWKPLEKNNFFADGAMARPLPEGTVARGAAAGNDLMSTGKINGQFADAFPFVVTEELVKRGQNQFTTFCTPCHGRLGDGNGMIVQRGFPRPNSFHTDSLRARPVGYFFDVMTNGFGKMYNYAASVTPKDRWAIAAYIRALQLSQRIDYSSLSDEEKKKVSDATVHPRLNSSEGRRLPTGRVIDDSARVPSGQKEH